MSMKQRDDMTFPFEEYERRIHDLRERMEYRRLDAVVITDPENLMYLTDYQTTGYSFFQALVVPLETEPFMITRRLEESNVHHRTWVENTRPYPDTGDAIQMLVEALREFGLAKKCVGYERNSYFFPAYHQDHIHTTFTRGQLLDCFGIVEQGRIRKSKFEIDVMRKAARATEVGMRAGFEACRPGVTENEIGAAISNAMFLAGGEPPAVMPYVTSGPADHDRSRHLGRPHRAARRTRLSRGGRLFPALSHRHDAHRAAGGDDRIHAKSPGSHENRLNRGQKADPAGPDRFRRRQSGAQNHHGKRRGRHLITRSGYSIGIAFPPSWDEGYILSLKQADSSILEEGMTIHLIPWMWGVDGDKTVGISDTIYITDDGCESFFTLEEDFVCKPGLESEKGPKKPAPKAIDEKQPAPEPVLFALQSPKSETGQEKTRAKEKKEKAK
jgi:Xaa-Pro dipeptidase